MFCDTEIAAYPIPRTVLSVAQTTEMRPLIASTGSMPVTL